MDNVLFIASQSSNKRITCHVSIVFLSALLAHFFPLILIVNCLLETGENFARFTRVSTELATISSYRGDHS